MSLGKLEDLATVPGTVDILEHVVWVHGISVISEDESDPDYSIKRYYGGTEISFNKKDDYWVYCSIPTPTSLTEGRVMCLRSVMVHFSSSAQTHIRTVRVNDGPQEIFYENGLVLRGSQFPQTVQLSQRPRLSLGIVVMMKVRVQAHVSERITFHGVGAEFISQETPRLQPIST
jgi:hypothetical protein